jgi:hypothetical protein
MSCDCSALHTRHLWRLTNSVALEPQGSSPYSQETALGSYSKPTESTPHPPANLPKIHSDPILPSTPRSSEWFLSFGLSRQNLVHFSVISHACNMSSRLHSPWFDLPNYILGWVQIMKLLIVQLPPFSCYFIPLRSRLTINAVMNVKRSSVCEKRSSLKNHQFHLTWYFYIPLFPEDQSRWCRVTVGFCNNVILAACAIYCKPWFGEYQVSNSFGLHTQSLMRSIFRSELRDLSVHFSLTRFLFP